MIYDARAEHRQPTAVVMELADGSVLEQAFASRIQAEMFVYLLPLQAMVLPGGGVVRSAILSPLVEVGAGASNTPSR